MSGRRSQAEWATTLRLALLGLGTASSAGTALELATHRHWGGTAKLVPWAALAIVVVGLAIWIARGLATVVGGASAYGVITHLRANYAAGPLDFRYETRWATMDSLDRWWAVLSDKVGDSPILAPGALVVAAACLVLGTLGHPALRDPAGYDT